ncbi:Uncharacterised protein [Mycobacterium tuberculosis]|uniref:Uncharacterized protein n=1 Tax=Mycobacterium tuberculosis TaxID=1773 RepID=A0A655ARI2_MYCTX|nr:Uncharacterised protein [Mycobacterium tuberculosis]CKT50743.1 Uncharacterised protein [Mycobacterium tuberculosis]COX03815.1 Uncharacterised protein [Mycobacterium tuberculosis]COX32565.1 Uncharacterised protein [Mycobacterium tuberculosis]COX73138.1 Uncharacterised protein [Mycobacterium tuberculosis]
MPGAIWNSISTPSMVWVSPVSVMSTVGTTSETSPVDSVCPRPQPTCPRRPRANTVPYM